MGYFRAALIVPLLILSVPGGNLCPKVYAATSQMKCKCDADRGWMLRPASLVPWLLVLLVIYIFYDSVGNYNPRKRNRSHVFDAAATVHILDSNNNTALAKREAHLPIKSEHFRGLMQLATEFAIEYLGNPEVYSVTNELKPGFLYKKMSKHMPEDPEPFSLILDDIYQFIMPGMTHWQHPRFHGYFPAGCSYPDIIAETIISSLAVIQFSWDSSPAFTELEVAMINWLGRAIGLDESFLFVGNAEQSSGGGALQPSSSDAVLIALLAARYKKINEIVSKKDPNYRVKQADVLGKLVAYASAEAHTCIEKACQLAMVRLRPIPASRDKFNMHGKPLEHEILKDLGRGLIPFFVHATSGTTSLCAFDDLVEITKVAKKYSMWSHVDAAYAGGAMICAEFRHLVAGINKADSINMNMHKFMLVSTTCAILWTKDQASIRAAYEIEPVYLKKTDQDATDFRHWGISLSRRTKSFKMWLLFRLYGLSSLQEYVRRLVEFAWRFHEHLKGDSRIEIIGDTYLSLVCFRVKGSNLEEANLRTSELCEFINRSHRILVTHAAPRKMDIVRICMCQERLIEEDIDESWRILKELMDEYFSGGDARISKLENQFNVDRSFRVSPCLTVESTTKSLVENVSSIGALSTNRSPLESPVSSPSRATSEESSVQKKR